MIISLIFSLSLKAQQEEYTAFLEQALQAVKEKNEKAFNSNLKYFSVAIDRDKITPDILTKKNYQLYTNCLYQALLNRWRLSNDLAQQAVEFLEYGLDNYPENNFSIGYLYEKGFGVSQDFDKAIYWYKKAVTNNTSHAAMNNLGYVYFQLKDYEQAKYWYERAVLHNNRTSMHGLGYLYEHGLGVTQDHKKAIELYEKSGNAGYVDAMFNLGLIYKEGTGTPQDYVKAKYWFKKAAESGDAEAMVYLGNLYLIGDSIMQDRNEAIFWFKKSCEAGFQKGCDNLNSNK